METMEAPTPIYESTKIKKPVKKPDNSIELELNSDKNINYDISIFYMKDKLYFEGITKGQLENKKYEKIYSLKEVKCNKYFYPHESAKEVFDELNLLIKNYKDIKEIKLLEEKDKLIIIFPLKTLKIKECIFEINEIILSNEERFDKIMNRLKEMQDKFMEENTLLKNEINGIKKENEKFKEMQNKFVEENNLLKKEINEIKKENKELKEQKANKNINIQTGEYYFDFPCGKHIMNTGTDRRLAIQHIKFEKAYESIPHVMVSLSYLDANANACIRVDLQAINIKTSGFDIEIRTWLDSSLFGVRVSWISFD